MNVRETMVAAVMVVATPLAHMSAAATVDISFSEMLEDVEVHVEIGVCERVKTLTSSLM